MYCCHVLQELYKQVAWPLYKSHGHAFEAFKNMVQDDGAAIFSKLQEGGALTVLTPQVSA
jgi:translation initiation factor 2 subunit 1